MPNQQSLEQVELAELTQTVDDGRIAADPFKLPASSRTLLDVRLSDLLTVGNKDRFLIECVTLLTEANRSINRLETLCFFALVRWFCKSISWGCIRSRPPRQRSRLLGEWKGS